ncbi:hypothetical protein BDD12DRAFT_296035 [Trichophaea hybrida]|nr:hypothetical protein BDD12DRAFT_296035 [Trichophaea hybrida]
MAGVYELHARSVSFLFVFVYSYCMHWPYTPPIFSGAILLRHGANLGSVSFNTTDCFNLSANALRCVCGLFKSYGGYVPFALDVGVMNTFFIWKCGRCVEEGKGEGGRGCGLGS